MCRLTGMNKKKRIKKITVQHKLNLEYTFVNKQIEMFTLTGNYTDFNNILNKIISWHMRSTSFKIGFNKKVSGNHFQLNPIFIYRKSNWEITRERNKKKNVKRVYIHWLFYLNYLMQTYLIELFIECGGIYTTD